MGDEKTFGEDESKPDQSDFGAPPVHGVAVFEDVSKPPISGVDIVDDVAEAVASLLELGVESDMMNVERQKRQQRESRVKCYLLNFKNYFTLRIPPRIWLRRLDELDESNTPSRLLDPEDFPNVWCEDISIL